MQHRDENALISIEEQNSNQIVNARELHTFLNSKQEFAHWIKNRIDEYGFIENEDFEVFDNFIKNPKGGRPAKDYAIKLDMAKELAMVERNDKGRQARRYFIAAEKELRTNQLKALPAQNWVVTAMQRKEKHIIARRLVEIYHLHQKQVAQLLGVTEKTISSWNKKEGWVLQEHGSFVLSPIDLLDKVELPKAIYQSILDVTNRNTRKLLFQQIDVFIDEINEGGGQNDD